MTSLRPDPCLPDVSRPAGAAVGRTLKAFGLAGVFVVSAGLAAGLGGCKGEEPPPVVTNTPAPRVVTPPPPPAPRVKTVADLMAELNIDDRIFMDEINAPASTEDRVAVLEFFDAFVRGRNEQVRPKLADQDRPMLDLMVDLEMWEPVTASIEEVELIAGVSPEGTASLLAMFVREGSDDEYQMWYMNDDGLGGSNFAAVPSPPGIVGRLAGDTTTYIEQWHEMLADEITKASESEIDVSLNANLDEDAGSVSVGSSGGGGSPGLRPGGGGGSPDRFRPTGKRRPPGPGQ